MYYMRDPQVLWSLHPITISVTCCVHFLLLRAEGSMLVHLVWTRLHDIHWFLLHIILAENLKLLVIQPTGKVQVIWEGLF